MGTAITEHQLQLLWRIADEPIIALDGDAAGLRAAMRAVDLALPLLEAGKSLRFALMPEGKDPDDLLRTEGPGAVQAVLEGAIPMVKLLWQRETEGKVFDSPERKAALDKALRDKIKLIRDPSIRLHYGQEIKDLRWQLFRPRRQPQNRPWQPRGKWQPQPTATPGARSSFLASSENADIQLREAAILAISILNPKVVVQFEQQLEEMECHNPDYAALRDAVLRHAIDDPDNLKDHIIASMGPDALENLLTLRHVAVIPCVSKPGDVEKAEMTLAEELAKIKALRGWMPRLPKRRKNCPICPMRR